MGGGGGVAQPQISLKTGRQSCVGRMRVSTSCGTFEPSRLDDELLRDLLKRLWAPPPYVHLASTWCHSRDEWCRSSPFFTALPHPCIIVNANQRTNGVGLGTRLFAPHLKRGWAAYNAGIWGFILPLRGYHDGGSAFSRSSLATIVVIIKILPPQKKTNKQTKQSPTPGQVQQSSLYQWKHNSSELYIYQHTNNWERGYSLTMAELGSISIVHIFWAGTIAYKKIKL